MKQGLDPALGAILPLVGVVVGAALGMFGTWSLRRRDEAREVRTATRLLDIDLKYIHDAVSMGVDGTDESDWEWFERLDTQAVWREQRAILARHLPDEEWALPRRVYEASRHMSDNVYLPVRQDIAASVRADIEAALSSFRERSPGIPTQGTF